MMFGSIILGAREWLVPAIILGALALLAMLYSYWRAPVGSSTRWLGTCLKLVAIAILILCLVEPLRSDKRPRAGANLFVLLVDNSQSMSAQDRRGGANRSEQVKAMLAADREWQTRLSQDFDVRWYRFDSRLTSMDDAQELTFNGTSSSMSSAMGTLADRFRDRTVAGVLLLTDGISTDANSDSDNYQDLPPVYPVLIGQDEAVKDIRIKDISVSQTNFEESPVTVRAEVEHDGYEGEKLVAELRTRSGALVETQTMPVADAGRATLFRFQFRPEAQGVSFYKLHVYAESEGDLFDSPGKSSEATLVNNQRLVLVDRGQGPYRVLYVSGRPNWEFKFLRRAVDEDSEVQLVGLVRIARREPKFDFRGHQDESTNPLYRGFGKEEEEQVEQYDEPVILRVGTRDETELRSGFPVDAEELFEYHALILDDVEAKFFTRDQMSLIQRFVSQRGGGFLMLGGMESYALGDYRNTPIGEMLPVYSTPVEIPVFNERFKVTLTREGMLEPWMRLQTTEVAERQRLDSMPEFRTVNLIDSIKPGATVLSRVTSSAGEDYPAVVAQRFGNGRTLAVTLGDLWRWSLRRDPEKPNELGKSWRQTMRWLVADVPQRVDVEVLQPKDLPAQTTNLRVLVRDPTYQPLDNAAVAVTVEDPTGHTTRLIAEASDTEAGVYETTLVPSEPGAYLAEVVATAADGSEVGKRSTGWTAEPARDEFRTLRPNRQLLARVAEQSGGEMIESNRLERFVSGLPQRDNVVTEPWIYPFWHQWWVFAFAVACLIGEWGLRRWKGLA